MNFIAFEMGLSSSPRWFYVSLSSSCKFKCVVSFYISGDFLKDKYDGATEVKITKRGLHVKNAQYNLPTANDLVYLDESPDYCLRNKTIGSFGNYSLYSIVMNVSSSTAVNCALCFRDLRETMQSYFSRNGRLQFDVLRPGLQHAQDDRQGAVQMQISLVLSCGMQNVRQNRRHSLVQVVI